MQSCIDKTKVISILLISSALHILGCASRKSTVHKVLWKLLFWPIATQGGSSPHACMGQWPCPGLCLGEYRYRTFALQWAGRLCCTPMWVFINLMWISPHLRTLSLVWAHKQTCQFDLLYLASAFEISLYSNSVVTISHSKMINWMFQRELCIITLNPRSHTIV